MIFTRIYTYTQKVYFGGVDDFLEIRTIIEKASLLSFILKSELSQEEIKQLIEIMVRSIAKNFSLCGFEVNELSNTCKELNRLLQVQPDKNRLTLG